MCFMSEWHSVFKGICLFAGCKHIKKCAVPSLFLPPKADAFQQTEGGRTINVSMQMALSWQVHEYICFQPLI